MFALPLLVCVALVVHCVEFLFMNLRCLMLWLGVGRLGLSLFLVQWAHRMYIASAEGLILSSSLMFGRFLISLGCCFGSAEVTLMSVWEVPFQRDVLARQHVAKRSRHCRRHHHRRFILSSLSSSPLTTTIIDPFVGVHWLKLVRTGAFARLRVHFFFGAVCTYISAVPCNAGTDR